MQPQNSEICTPAQQNCGVAHISTGNISTASSVKCRTSANREDVSLHGHCDLIVDFQNVDIASANNYWMPRRDVNINRKRIYGMSLETFR